MHAFIMHFAVASNHNKRILRNQTQPHQAKWLWCPLCSSALSSAPINWENHERSLHLAASCNQGASWLAKLCPVECCGYYIMSLPMRAAVLMKLHRLAKARYPHLWEKPSWVDSSLTLLGWHLNWSVDRKMLRNHWMSKAMLQCWCDSLKSIFPVSA